MPSQFSILLMLGILLLPLLCLSGLNAQLLYDDQSSADSICSTLNGDVCTCKSNDCEFHAATSTCYPSQLECSDVNTTNPDECRRPNVYYSVGGAICKSKEQSGLCGFDETILAVNLNGKQVHGSRGIVHDEGINYPPQSGAEFVQGYNLRDFWTGPVYGTSGKDELLYETLMQGKPPGSGGHCVVYPIALKDDGRYELSVKTMDGYYDSAGQRTFSIYFAGLSVFPEMDIVKTADTRPCEATFTAVELVANFQLKANGADFEIQMEGFSAIIVPSESITLEICFGTCSFASSILFSVAAFSVVRFGTGTGIEKSECDCWRHDVCKCRLRECEYSTAASTCVPAYTDCQNLPGIPTSTILLQCRPGVLYSHGGVICSNLATSCTTDGTVLAVNFGAENETVGGNGIVYQPSMSVPPISAEDHMKYFTYINISGLLDPADEALFDSVMYGTQPYATEQCLAYKIPLSGDGSYELLVKTLEAFYHLPGKRLFTIKFAGLSVFPEIDLIRLLNISPTENQFTAVDLGLAFTVVGNVLTASGFDEVVVINGETLLEFCYSQCKNVNPSFVAAAFAVTKVTVA